MKQTKVFHDNSRFISVSVYKFPLGNCGGVTDSKKTIYIPSDDGNYKFSELKDRLELIFYTEHRGGDYHAVIPIMQPEGLVGPMSGGNLAYSSDSRCARVYHIHDRFESQEVYNTLSR